jgi:hypothetical protein
MAQYTIIQFAIGDSPQRIYSLHEIRIWSAFHGVKFVARLNKCTIHLTVLCSELISKRWFLNLKYSYLSILT